MRRPLVHLALRNGLIGAVIIAALGSVNALVQARRHAIGPSAQALVVFSYLFILVAVLLLLAVGFLTARSTGRVGAGAWAGAITAGLPSALLVLVVSLQTTIPQDLPRSTQIAGDVIAILLFAAAGALAGTVVSLLGTLVGRVRYRVEHAEELAALAAVRAARDAETPDALAVPLPTATSQPLKKYKWVFVWRSANRLKRTDLLPIAEPPEQPPVFFRHDGQAIVIYPSQRKLAAHATFAGGVALIASALAVLFRTAGPALVFALSAFAVMGLIGFVPDLVRLLHRWPALIVNSDGVTDLASAQILGFGLIPWHEIAGIVNAGTRRGGAFPELAIIPMSYHRLLTRQPFLKRPFLRLGSAMGGGGIYISSIVLSQPPSELAQRIYDFVKLHAPASYMELDEREDDAENATQA